MASAPGVVNRTAGWVVPQFLSRDDSRINGVGVDPGLFARDSLHYRDAFTGQRHLMSEMRLRSNQCPFARRECEQLQSKIGRAQLLNVVGLFKYTTHASASFMRGPEAGIIRVSFEYLDHFAGSIFPNRPHNIPLTTSSKSA